VVRSVACKLRAGVGIKLQQIAFPGLECGKLWSLLILSVSIKEQPYGTGTNAQHTYANPLMLKNDNIPTDFEADVSTGRITRIPRDRQTDRQRDRANGSDRPVDCFTEENRQILK